MKTNGARETALQVHAFDLHGVDGFPQDLRQIALAIVVVLSKAPYVGKNHTITPDIMIYLEFRY